MKEKKEQSESNKFFLTDYIKSNGYSATINGNNYAVRRQVFGENYDNNNNLVQAVVEDAMAYFNSKFTGGAYFEDLPFLEQKTLATAKVIKLNKQQAKEYRQWYIKQVPEDDE
jgi:hypothetical protein